MSNGQKIVDIAKLAIGTEESPPNSNKTRFGEWFGLNGQMWCGIFVSYCYAKAGFPLGNIGFPKGFAGCQTAVAHFRSTGEITTNPQSGDIVFFDWNGDGRFDHVGIFQYRISSTAISTIEGNTSLKNDSNGGSVMERSRTDFPLREGDNYTKCIFVHPKVLDV